ncbi:hypothetical protein AB4079_09060 [Leifsonia sp. 2MCAF36]
MVPPASERIVRVPVNRIELEAAVAFGTPCRTLEAEAHHWMWPTCANCGQRPTVAYDPTQLSPIN